MIIASKAGKLAIIIGAFFLVALGLILFVAVNQKTAKVKFINLVNGTSLDTKFDLFIKGEACGFMVKDSLAKALRNAETVDGLGPNINISDYYPVKIQFALFQSINFTFASDESKKVTVIQITDEFLYDEFEIFVIKWP